MLQRLLSLHNLIVDQLKIAKAKQKHYAYQLSTPKQFYVGEKVMLNTQNLNLLNQPSKKFRSRYISPYKILEKISFQDYKLDLPLNMKVHPIFNIGFLKEFNSSPHESEAPDDIPLSNDVFNGGDTFMSTPLLVIKSLLTLKLMPKAQLSYLKVKWEGYDFSEDSWDPYIHVKRTDCFNDYIIRNSDKFRLLLLSNEYKKINSSYSSRFPRLLSFIVRS